MWPANKTAKPRTILQILSTLPIQDEKHAVAARDTQWMHPEFLQARKKPKRTADIRDQQTEIKQVANPRRYETGYAQYLKAAQLRGKAKIDSMHDLYTLYSHTDDTISTFIGISQHTAHVGKEMRRRKQGDTVQQYIVQWAPVVQPLWVVLAAQTLEYYHKGEAVELEHGDEGGKACHSPCEFCKERVAPAEQAVHTCEVC
jgi:hypothetical protein